MGLLPRGRCKVDSWVPCGGRRAASGLRCALRRSRLFRSLRLGRSVGQRSPEKGTALPARLSVRLLQYRLGATALFPRLSSPVVDEHSPAEPDPTHDAAAQRTNPFHALRKGIAARRRFVTRLAILRDDRTQTRQPHYPPAVAPATRALAISGKYQLGGESLRSSRPKPSAPSAEAPLSHQIGHMPRSRTSCA